MTALNELMCLPDTKMVLAGRHFRNNPQRFYSEWALRVLELGFSSPSIVELAGISANVDDSELGRIIDSALKDLGVLHFDQSIAATIIILETLRVLSVDVQMCWQQVQELRLIQKQPGRIGHIQEEIQRFDLELWRAGDPEAQFETVESGIWKFRDAAESFVNRSSIRLVADRLRSNCWVVEVDTPDRLLA